MRVAEVTRFQSNGKLETDHTLRDQSSDLNSMSPLESSDGGLISMNLRLAEFCSGSEILMGISELTAAGGTLMELLPGEMPMGGRLFGGRLLGG